MFPKSYSGLTISKYQQLKNLMGMDFPEAFDRDIRILALLGDMKVSEVEDMSIQDFNKARDRVSFIYSQGNHPLPASFWLNGVMYKVNTDPRKVKASGYIDITSYTKNEKERITNLHLLMATICTPFKLGIKEMQQTTEERAEIFKEHLTMDKVIPVTVFFLKLSQKLHQNIQSFLLDEVEKRAKNLMKEIPTKQTSVGL